jgi:hypothetical protein
MPLTELDNLVKVGQLKREPASSNEQKGLLASAVARLADAERQNLAYESRFDLAYNAAHAFALYALRRKGYRSENRYLVFQCLEHTLGIPAALWRVLAKAHEKRNRMEYEGSLDRDEQLLKEMISAVATLQAAIGTQQE